MAVIKIKLIGLGARGRARKRELLHTTRGRARGLQFSALPPAPMFILPRTPHSYQDAAIIHPFDVDDVTDTQRYQAMSRPRMSNLSFSAHLCRHDHCYYC